MSEKRLLRIIVGPTAVGKTDYSIGEAIRWGSPIISCDSRQIYQEMSIGTAVPSAAQLAAVRHYFIQTCPVTELYTAGQYEVDALQLIRSLFDQGHDVLVMAGGSGFYVDALCNGLEETPPTDLKLRAALMARLASEGLPALAEELRRLDPEAVSRMDISNPQRVVRALEVCMASGRPFSSFKPSAPKKRDFAIEKIGLRRSREVLYDRIDRRVLQMMEEGLLEEVRSLFPYRDLPALRTVGYRELFDWIDVEQGRIPGGGMAAATAGEAPRKIPSSLDEAVSLIQQHTRNYAKRQMTWWRRDPDIHWIDL